MSQSSEAKSPARTTKTGLPHGLNEVHLIGRISSEPLAKVLPSGDQVVEFRLVVGRLPASPVGRKVSKDAGKIGVQGAAPKIDTLDIAAWSAKARRSALALKSNTWVEIHGAVRRRFWQAPTGLASRWQVEASEIRAIKVIGANKGS
jgi:single-strand DNA-binding protein